MSFRTFDRTSRLHSPFRDVKEPSILSKSLSQAKKSPMLPTSILRSALSPVQRLNKFQISESTLVNELIIQCKRINGHFDANISSEILNISIINIIRRVIDMNLDLTKNDQAALISNFHLKITEMTEQLEQANKKLSLVAENERKQKMREERLAIDEIKIDSEKSIIQNEKVKAASMIKHNLQLENEVKTLKKEIKAEKKDKERIQDNIRELMTENMEKDSELQELKTQNDELQNKLEKLVKQIGELKNREVELKETLKTLELSKNHSEEYEKLDKLKTEIESSKLEIEIENGKIIEIKRQLEIEKIKLATFHQLPNSKKNNRVEKETNTTKSDGKFTSCKDSIDELVIEGKGIYQNMNVFVYFPQIKDLIITVLQETDQCRKFIEEWFNNLTEREAQLNITLDDLIQLYSKDQHHSNTIKESDSNGMSKVSNLEIKQSLSKILMKKRLLDESFKMNFNKISYNENYSYDGKNFELFSEMIVDFEKKTVELSDLEIYLKALKENIESQYEDNAKIAKYLKEQHLEFEEERAVIESMYARIQIEIDQGIDKIRREQNLL